MASNQYGLLNNNNTWTGINGFSSPSNSFTGVGTGLTALNASNLGSGTVPGARLTGTYGNALTLNNAGNSFTGSGAGLTGVNANLLDGIDSTAFLQGIPNPLIVSGDQQDGVIRITNTPSSPVSSALSVYQTGNGDFFIPPTALTGGGQACGEREHGGEGRGSPAPVGSRWRNNNETVALCSAHPPFSYVQVR